MPYSYSELGLKDRQKFSDIEWLMPSVDLEYVFNILQINITGHHGNEYTGYCPDHFKFTGREPSDPKWTLNSKSGKTFCFTEGRGSNIVWIGCRLLNKQPDEVAHLFTHTDTDTDFSSLEINAILKKSKELLAGENKSETKTGKSFSELESEIRKHYITQRTYDFFMSPPGKPFPTNIRRETVDRYGVFERSWGYYSDRALIPYVMRGKIVGFCALDVLGKKAWLEKHDALIEKDYRKVLYPEGFMRTECLFGYDDCRKNCDMLFILEGAREVMKLSQEGFSDAVAISGAHMSNTQWLAITELNPKHVVLMFDGDMAGTTITENVKDMLVSNFPGNRLIPCYLPTGRDPKTLDGKELAELVEESVKRREKDVAHGIR